MVLKRRSFLFCERRDRTASFDYMKMGRGLGEKAAIPCLVERCSSSLGLSAVSKPHMSLVIFLHEPSGLLLREERFADLFPS